MQLAIELPDPVFQHLERLARLTNQSLDELVVQSIKGNLPPTVETVPAEIQDELLALQTASVENLRQVAQSEVPEAQQQQYLALLEQNQMSQLSSKEQQELRHLMLLTDQLMLKKAHACAILRWRGQPILSLDELAVS